MFFFYEVWPQKAALHATLLPYLYSEVMVMVL